MQLRKLFEWCDPYQWTVVSRWDARLLTYNIFLILMGIPSTLLILFVGPLLVQPGTDYEEPFGFLVLPLIVILLANAGYAFSAKLDSIVTGKRESRPMIFRAYLGLTVIALLAPGVGVIVSLVVVLSTGHRLS